MVSVAAIEHTIRHTALRGLGFGGMLAIALIHLLDVINKIKETPYLGGLYILLMVSSIAVAFAVLHKGSALSWAAAGGLAALTLIGFILSRTTGLPSATADIGNWTEKLGLASMLVEGCGHSDQPLRAIAVSPGNRARGPRVDPDGTGPRLKSTTHQSRRRARSSADG